MSTNDPRTMSHISLDFVLYGSNAVDMEPIAPDTIRYIKLGGGGRWEAAALDGGRLEWGNSGDPHDLALEGDWAAVRQHYVARGASAAVATGYTNEARIFYEASPNTLWISFARGRMLWGFAEPAVIWTGGDELSHATRHRKILGGWSDRDINGQLLNLERLSTRLTCLAAYRRTSCALNDEQRQLCLRYINATIDEDQRTVAVARQNLEQALLALIQRLSWADFEELVDHILHRSGWTRISTLGGLQKDVDLVVEQPLTGERMAVQVKSTADAALVRHCAQRLSARPVGERLMLVCHSPQGAIDGGGGEGRPLELLMGGDIARKAIQAGLLDWVVQRA